MSNFLLETVKAQPCSMVVVHPTVLLSIVDHYNRSGNATTSKRRVVGTLIGEYGDKGQLHVTNSFAVPFNEDLADFRVFEVFQIPKLNQQDLVFQQLLCFCLRKILYEVHKL